VNRPSSRAFSPFIAKQLISCSDTVDLYFM
jgi:hypothetical protein